ncbi:MAG: hypothetical protein R3F43_33030, partial [bacterium]
CGNACDLRNASARCGAGSCQVAECLGGFVDIDGLAENGCEYACQLTNGGLERCDVIDNDCDGRVDEDAPVDADPENCGACGRRCAFANAAGLCQAGACQLGDCAPGFVNLDNNPLNGCEYACVFQNDADAPDAAGVDADCDGIDGELNGSIFVRPNGDDGRNGQSPANAVASLARGIALAAGDANRRVVLVANGVYRTDATLSVVAGVSVHGGYSLDFRTRNAEHASLQVTAPVGVRAVGLRGPALLEQIDIDVTNRSNAGESAIGVLADDSQNHLRIVRAVIRAGRGGAGVGGNAGGRGANGTGGSNGSGSSGGGGGATGGALAATATTAGPATRAPRARSTTGPCGATRAPASGGGGLGCNDGDPRAGGPGGPGCGGRAAALAPAATTWAASTASPSCPPTVLGARGGTGGGGGGGAGGGENCRVLGQCVYCGTGRGGGGGGGGGQGGAGGTGGTGGGASIGVLVRNSQVTAEDVRIETVGGGAGGAGAGGGGGGSGGPGSGQASGTNTEGTGGDGGPAATAAPAAAAVASGGGPSIAAWGLGGATLIQRGQVDLVAGVRRVAPPAATVGRPGPARAAGPSPSSSPQARRMPARGAGVVGLALALVACTHPPKRLDPPRIVATIEDPERLDFIVKSRIYPENPHRLVLTGRRSGVSIWDVSTAAAPRPLAHWGPGLDVEGQDRLGDLLVVVARAGLLLTFSLEGDALRLRGQVALRADPTPTERAIGGLLHLVGGGPFAALHVALRQAGGRTHAFVSAPVSGELIAVDVTDPAHPRQVGAVDTGVELVEGVGLSGDHALVGGFGRDGRLRTIDLRDPTHLRVVGGREAPAWRQLVAARDPARPDLLFAALWDDPGGLGVFDLSEPARPAVHGLLLHPDLARANRVALARDRAWLPLERSPGGVAGVDVRDPAHPRLAHLLVGIPGIDTPYTLAASGDFLYVFSSRAPKMVVLEVPRGGPP